MVRATDRREPMTFSQREKVPMERPRSARAFHRRLRGEITRATIHPVGPLHGTDPGYTLTGLNTNAAALPRTIP